MVSIGVCGTLDPSSNLGRGPIYFYSVNLILIMDKKTTHLALIVVLLAGTLFAWYNSAKELGIIACEAGCAIAETMFGLPICVWGAIFFTLALILSIMLWYQSEYR